MLSLLVVFFSAAAPVQAAAPKARVVIEALDERSRADARLVGQLRDAVAKDGTFALVPANEDAKGIAAAQERWLNAMTGQRKACEFRTENAPPYVLRAKINGLMQKKELVLTLLSGEVSCTLASVTAPFDRAWAEGQLKAILEALVSKLPHKAEVAPEEVAAPVNLPPMVRVPAGDFFRGCNEKADPQCDRHESPGGRVVLAAYEIDTTEVTVAAYAVCAQTGKCSAVANFSPTCNWGLPGKENHPINCVTWEQARDFCASVNKRLPTEAEWEKAARGSDGRLFPWGNGPATCKQAVMADDKGVNGCGRGPGTWRVGSKPAGASPYGALDMAGNVAEWVADWYDGAAYQGAPARDPQGPAKGAMRVFRGGGYFDAQRELRASHRERNEPGLRNGALGFRCARSLP